VKTFDDVTLTAKPPSCTEQLARFFPEATSVRIPVQVTALRGGSTRLREASVLEYAAAEHAIFDSTLPLEFDDRVRLEGKQKESTTDATVVAVQYHDGRKAVAVKFSRGPNHWISRS
jgi:hypothetical protein